MLGSIVLPVIQELILIIRGEQEKERERFGLPRLDDLLELTWGYKVGSIDCGQLLGLDILNRIRLLGANIF